GQFVDIDVAGDVDAPGQIAAIVFPGRSDLLRHGRHVAVIPDRIGAPDGEPCAIGRRGPWAW
ncbi:MAG: hypothetical protein ACREXY_17325, partial [Gammaproteobacteria bacterium]